MRKSRVLVKLYGESFKVHVLDIKKHLFYLERFQEIAFKLNEPLELALLNVDFYKILNCEKIQSVQDLIIYTFGGLINNSKNKIEIRQGRKTLQKFSLDDLFNPKTLFPLFNAQLGNISLKLSRTIFLLEKEVGLIAAYEVDPENFEINKLKFNICNVEYNKDNYQLLLALSYNSKKLPVINSDTLITYQHCISHST